MTTATEPIKVRRTRPAARTPRPLPVWMQLGVVALLLAQGAQTAIHVYSSRVAQTAPASSPEKLSGFEYTYYYTPDRLTTAVAPERTAYDPYARYNGNMQSNFQYSGYYAHTPSAMSVMPIHAYSPSTGRWVDRDPLPAK